MAFERFPSFLMSELQGYSMSRGHEILANPDFDVEGFIKNINIHYQNPSILTTLGSNAPIILGLIQDDKHQFLEIMPQIINPQVFKDIHDLGYTVYWKTEDIRWRQKSYWAGAIINDELALWFRRVGYQRTTNDDFEVIKGADLIQKKIKSWKKRGLQLFGSDIKKKVLPVYQVRKDVWNWAKDNLGMERGHNYCKPTHSKFYWWTPSVKYGGTYCRLTILQAGKEHVRVKTTCNVKKALIPYKSTPKRAKGSEVIIVTLSEKFKIDDPNLCLKIMSWAFRCNSAHAKFEESNGLKTKMKRLRKKAGIK